MIIDILDWNLTYHELVEWVTTHNIELDAITDGSSTGTKYIFCNEEDFLAFKLKFAKEKSQYIGYEGRSTIMNSAFYCPHIPVMKLKIPITVKLPHRVGVNQIGDWMLSRKILDRVTHDWITGTLSFEDEEDALAFCITFGAQRFETTVERMLKNEESNN